MLAFVAAACTSDGGTTSTTTSNVGRPTTPAEESPTTSGESTTINAESVEVVVPPDETAAARNQLGYTFPPAPTVPTGPTDDTLAADLDALFGGLSAGTDTDLILSVGQSGDARAAWLLADLHRFIPPGFTGDALVASFQDLTNTDLDVDPISARSTWQSMTDHLLAWDLPALDEYAEWKRQLFTLVDPRWAPFFEDGESTIDWRVVSWGGVFIDDRPLGATMLCAGGCIPALDDPAVTDAAGGDWYPDDALVFGITLNGEARAYPKNIMEVHEMVNDTLGGRRLGIPYCTLCGSAQAYLTDGVPDGIEVPLLRTSGLLSRSNKVMFDLNTYSVFDTFTGEAVAGPLREAGIVLEQVSVVGSTWGAWKEAHPDTTIIAEDGGIGRSYSDDPLQGRDDDGPIFPIGDVDERLGVQDKVLGVIAPDGIPVAFDVAAARAVLTRGGTVEFEGISVVADGSGVRASLEDGSELAGHEAFWFAWSQFHPDTLLWTTEG